MSFRKKVEEVAITSQFSMAVQALLLIGRYQDRKKIVGDRVAASIGTNPALIRRIILKLKEAGLVLTTPGIGGIRLARQPEDITLLDIYQATAEPEDGIFRLHPNPNPLCPVGRNIYTVLKPAMDCAQSNMEHGLQDITLSGLLAELERNIKAQHEKD